MSDRQGPKVTIDASCLGCKFEASESYQVQGDSGSEVYCNATGNRIGDTTWKTPEWCPFLVIEISQLLRDRLKHE